MSDHSLKRRRRWIPRIPHIAALCLSTVAKAQDDLTPKIVVQPAMFGAKWTGTPTTILRTIIIDLCNRTDIQAATDGNIFSQSNTSSSGDTEALFFDAVGMSSECSYADMAQAAEQAFPTANYLLISRVDVLAMTKFPREADTTLSLAAVSLEDSQAINNGFSSSNSTTVPSGGGILVTIDAVSRALIEVCDCPADDADEPVELLSLLMRISASLSIIGSIFIMFTIVGTKERRSTHLPLLFNRLLLGVSISDLISSIAVFIGRWAFPTTPPGDYEGSYSLDLWEMENRGAFGTPTTCAIEGVFLHLGNVGSCVFTCCLAIQTLLVVRYGWKNNKLSKVGPLFFGLGIGLPLAGAVTAVSIGMMNQFDVGFCWIRKSPAKCDYDDEEEIDEDTGKLAEPQGGPLLDVWCDEVYVGTKPFLIQLGLGLIWILLAVFICLGCMISLFFFVRDQENRAARWQLTARDGRHQNVVLARAIMYFIAFLLVWIPSIVALAMQSEAFQFVIAILMPLQGFLNALICSGCVDKCCLKPKEEERDRSSSYQFSHTDGTKSFKMSKLTAGKSVDSSRRWGESFKLSKHSADKSLGASIGSQDQ